MTRALLKGLVAFVALAYVSPAPARAADDAKSQAYVVVVGIDKYKDPQILPRKHAEDDAKLLFDVFVDPNYLGVEASHIKLLLGKADAKRKSEPASKANILKALNWVVENATKDDLVLVVFIGQGAPVGDRTCYFMPDSTFKDRAKDTLMAADIEAVMDKLKSNRFCGFVDVNFKGFKSTDKNLDPDVSKMYREWMGKDDEVAAPPSRLLFLANAGVKPSLDLADHGVFAKVVAEGLKGKADTSGYEPDGLITADELVTFVRKEMPVLARLHGKVEDEKIQKPVILEGHNGDFVLDRNPAIAAVAKKRIDQFEKIAKNSKLAKEVVEEGTGYLKRMPKLEAQQSLRKLYQKLADGTMTVEAFNTERATVLASMKLPDAEANDYGRKVLAAAMVTVTRYYKKINSQQLVSSAIKGLYHKLAEPIPSTIKERLDNIKNLQEAGMLTLLADARKHLGKREDLAGGKDVTFSLHPMLSKLDRHSDYIDPDTVKKFQSDLQGSFSGIGVQIRQNQTRDELQVITPIKGSPAYKAKIYAGDVITHIVREVDSEGNPLAAPEITPTKGLPTDQAVKKILGKAGTPVKLIIEREGEAKPLEFTLIRGTVEVETVLGHKRNADDSWNYVIDPENGICYVRLTQFQASTARDLEALMKKLSKAGIKGFILDLRFNPGGLLTQAAKISDIFIDDGMIVTIKYGGDKMPESYMGKSDGSYTHFPMVCLVNGYSASASEIVAACLQDHGRAIIMGSRSYGKGSVQGINEFPPTGGYLKITIATYWRPNGRNINKPDTSGKDEEDWGVKPDKGYNKELTVNEINDLQDHLRDREIIHRPGAAPKELNPGFSDAQLEMALEYLRQQIKMKTAKKAG